MLKSRALKAVCVLGSLQISLFNNPYYRRYWLYKGNVKLLLVIKPRPVVSPCENKTPAAFDACNQLSRIDFFLLGIARDDSTHEFKVKIFVLGGNTLNTITMKANRNALVIFCFLKVYNLLRYYS